VARDLTFAAAPDEGSFTLIGCSRISREGIVSRDVELRDLTALFAGSIDRVVGSLTLCSVELGTPVDAWATDVTHSKHVVTAKNTDLMST
jgi:hypothetical protein